MTDTNQASEKQQNTTWMSYISEFYCCIGLCGFEIHRTPESENISINHDIMEENIDMCCFCCRCLTNHYTSNLNTSNSNPTNPTSNANSTPSFTTKCNYCVAGFCHFENGFVHKNQTYLCCYVPCKC